MTTLSAEWQPIETAPKDGTWILLYDPTASSLIYTGCWDSKFDSKWVEEKDDFDYIGAWTSYQVGSFGYEEYATLSPTHWMLLPKPPKSEAQ